MLTLPVNRWWNSADANAREVPRGSGSLRRAASRQRRRVQPRACGRGGGKVKLEPNSGDLIGAARVSRTHDAGEQMTAEGQTHMGSVPDGHAIRAFYDAFTRKLVRDYVDGNLRQARAFELVRSTIGPTTRTI